MLYSHDSWGLGHLRRSLAIAHALQRKVPQCSILVASGSPSATAFPIAPGIDILKLPSVTKGRNGQYQARQLIDDVDDVVRLRRALLGTAFKEFRPDLLVVDHQVIGLRGEVLPLLQLAQDTKTYCVYGMRDVLDSVHPTETGWSSVDCRWALQEAYDEIWVYGDRQHFSTTDFYPTLHDATSKSLYTGLITNDQITEVTRKSDRPQVLVTIGGGEDGGSVIKTLLLGLREHPHDWDCTIVTGPMLRSEEQSEIEALASPIRNIEIHRFHDSIPGLMRASDVVVCMAGYNTCAEFIAARRRAVLVPRTEPRQEQLIRATYLQDSGIASYLVQPTPEELITQINLELESKSISKQFPSCGGLAVVASRAAELIRTRHDMDTAQAALPQ